MPEPYNWKNDLEEYIRQGEPAQPEGGELNQIVFNGKTYYINVTDSNVADLANTAQAFAGGLTADKSATAQGTSLVFKDLDLGYYLVLPVDATEIAEGNGSICSLTNAAPEGEINSEGTYPDIDKTVNVQDVEVGQTVTYTVTGQVPDTTGYRVPAYRSRADAVRGCCSSASTFTAPCDAPADTSCEVCRTCHAYNAKKTATFRLTTGNMWHTMEVL